MENCKAADSGSAAFFLENQKNFSDLSNHSLQSFLLLIPQKAESKK